MQENLFRKKFISKKIQYIFLTEFLFKDTHKNMEVTPKNPGIEPSKYANVAELNFLCYLVFISVDIRATHQFSHETGQEHLRT